MQRGSGEHEHVPHEVEVPQPVRRVEDHAARVRKPACDQQQYSRQRDRGDQRSQRDDDHPSHRQVECDREPVVPCPRVGDGEEPDGGETPDDAEQRPAPRPSQHAQRKRCVRPRNQEEYRAVVDHAEDAFCVPFRKAVVERRGQVEHCDGRGKDARADDRPRPALVVGREHEERRADDDAHDAEAVTDRIGEVFAWRLEPFHFRGHPVDCTLRPMSCALNLRLVYS